MAFGLSLRWPGKIPAFPGGQQSSCGDLIGDAARGLVVTKLICTGEGGFCLTGDPALADRLRQLHNLGRPPRGGELGAGFGLNYKLPALAAASSFPGDLPGVPGVEP